MGYPIIKALFRVCFISGMVKQIQWNVWLLYNISMHSMLMLGESGGMAPIEYFVAAFFTTNSNEPARLLCIPSLFS